jgi:hypothetical protein
MSETKEIEENELFAVRVPPGDKWKLVADSKQIIHPSLMDVLEAYFTKTQFKGDFRLSPSEGELFAIKTREEVVLPTPEKKYNIYGDPA